MTEREELEQLERWAAEQDAAAQSPYTLNQVGRQVGLTGRHLATGLAALPLMVPEAIIQGKNALTGSNTPGAFATFQKGLTELGFPEPQGRAERVVGAAASGAAGGAGFAGMAGQAIKTAALSGAGAGTGGQLAREGGAGPVGQMAAGLAGGMVPHAVAAGGGPLLRMGTNVVKPLSQSGRDSVKGNLLNTAAGDKRLSVMDNMKENQQFVPGVKNTAATAASPAGSTEFAALEKLLADRYAPTKFRDMAKDNQAARIDVVEGQKAALVPRIEDAMGDVMPDSKEVVSAINHFAKQANAMQRMESRLTGPLGQETAGQFSRAFEGSKDILSPVQRRTLGGVQQDLIRQHETGQQARAGMQAATHIVGEARPVQPIPPFLDRVATIARTIVGRVQHGTSERTLKELTNDLMSPEKVANLMKNATPPEKRELAELVKAMAAGQAGAANQIEGQ